MTMSSKHHLASMILTIDWEINASNNTTTRKSPERLQSTSRHQLLNIMAKSLLVESTNVCALYSYNNPSECTLMPSCTSQEHFPEVTQGTMLTYHSAMKHNLQKQTEQISPYEDCRFSPSTPERTDHSVHRFTKLHSTHTLDLPLTMSNETKETLSKINRTNSRWGNQFLTISKSLIV